jgi:ketosteroid isomerase-like protein
MSEQTVKIVRDVYGSFAAGDVEAVFAAMTPDIEWDESEGMPYGGVYHGRDAILSNVFGPILADVEGFTATPDEVLALDDTRVVALGRMAARARTAQCAPASYTSGPSPTAWCRATSNSPTPTPSEPPSASSHTSRQADHLKLYGRHHRRVASEP